MKIRVRPQVFVISAFAIVWLYAAGCATMELPRTPVKAEIISLDWPPLGIEATGELGNSIISNLKAIIKDALVLKGTVDAMGEDSRWASILSIKLLPDIYVAEYEDADGIFYKNTVQALVLGPSERVLKQDIPGGIYVPRSDVQKKAAFFEHKGTVQKTEMLKVPVLEDTTITTITPEYFRRELVYNGIAGSRLRFIYREFAGEMIRPAFTLEVDYDLTMGDTIGYKGARFKILEATNTHIRYVPIRYFE